MNWREIPFVRLVVPFAAGIFGYSLSREWEYWPFALPVLLVWATGLAIWSRRRMSYREACLFGLGLVGFLMLAGGTLAHRACEKDRPPHWEEHLPGARFWLGRVVEARRSRLVFQVWGHTMDQRHWEKATGRWLVYLPADSTASPGDTLLLFGRPARVAPPRNPKEFDYSRYLANHGIYYRFYVPTGQYLCRPERRPGGWQSYAFRLRSRCLAILKRRLPDPDAFAVGAALTLGYREELEMDLQEAYAASGAMHILAVSGLHVGLVFFGLQFLLSWIPGFRWLRIAGQLAGIWGFVMLAGLPPSAVRAAAMCSFFAVGRAANRQANPFNSLAASAFCMLAVDPRQFFEVGFQLSYLAVGGILLLQGPIYRSWYVPSRLGNYLWKLLSVSLAAQIGTLAVSLYYFHQFPLLFWLSGFVAIPAATVSLGGGLALLLLDKVPLLGLGLGAGLNGLLTIVNDCMRLLADLPGAQVSGIWIGATGVAAYYGLLILLVAGRQTRQPGYWWAALLLVLATSITRAAHFWQLTGQRRLVVYYVHQHSLFDVWDGRRFHTFLDEELPEGKQERAARNFRWFRQGIQGNIVSLHDGGQGAGWRYEAGLLQFYQRRLLVIDSSTQVDRLPRLSVDALLIRGDPDLSITDVAAAVSARVIIVDASNSPRQAERWRQQCAGLALTCHDIRRTGAAVIEW